MQVRKRLRSPTGIVRSIEADIDRAMTPDFIQPRGHRLRERHRRRNLQFARARARHDIIYGPQHRIEQRGLITVAERRNGCLNQRMKFQTEMGRDHQIPGPLELARMGQSCIEIGREKQGVGKVAPQSLEDHQLVVHVAAQHADGLELAVVTRFFALEGFNQPSKIVQLTAAGRSLRQTLLPTQSPVSDFSFRLSATGILLSILGRQLAVEAGQVGITVHPVRILFTAQAIKVILEASHRAIRPCLRQAACHRDECTRQGPPVERVPFRDQSDMRNPALPVRVPG